MDTLRWPQVEYKLEKWVFKQRAVCRSVSTTEIRLKTQQITKDDGLPECGRGVLWCARFMIHRNLSLRTAHYVPEAACGLPG